MGLKYTLKKKDNKQDERTVQAEDFIMRVRSMEQRKIEKLKEIPNTEIKK